MMAFILLVPSVGLAWFGLELDSSLTGTSDPYETAGGGEGGIWELSGRAMVSESFDSVDAEAHWLVTTLGSLGDRSLPVLAGPNPFRSLDLEDTHHTGDNTAIFSEFDRLWIALNGKDVHLTLGRQAVSWGEAYYYNIGDLFGAFPITETNRLYKTGIDAVSIDIDLGPFSTLSAASVPSDEGEDSLAGRVLFPLGPGSLTLTAGSVLQAALFGAGCTVDVRGTKVYSTGLFTDPDGEKEFLEFVLGAERQTGAYTRIAGELYFNGWGADDGNDYPDLLFSERYQSGRALALGRWNMAFEISRQMSALLTVTPAFFANLSDGSVLLRLDGGYSASDLTTVSGGLFAGFGDRTDGAVPESEFGQMPATIFVEVVHSL